MRVRAGFLTVALLALGAGAESGVAAEAKTWYVYCEGNSGDGHWAVFSENFWPHAGGADYGRRVGDAAKAFFEARHALSLDGCAGVNFRNDSLAKHSRSVTVQLHRRMGDRVYFFPLPREVLPEDDPLYPVVAAAGEAAADGAESADPARRQDAGRAWERTAQAR
jgi:hypothetical protein